MKIRIKNPIWGVPITFLDNYNPKQFEILGIACGNSWANYTDFLKSLNFNPNIKYGGGLGTPILNGKATYARLLIKRAPQFKIVGIACGNTRANTPKETLNELGYKPSSEDKGGCPIVNGKRKYARILSKENNAIIY